jgi:hypothetical protein
MDHLIVTRDVFSDDSDEDEVFPPLRKLPSSSSHEKISVDAKPSLYSTTEKVNSRTRDGSHADSSSSISRSRQG